MGGVERYLLNVTKGLKKHSISSTILTRYYPPLSKKEHYTYFDLARIGFNPFPKPTTKRYFSGFIAFTADRFSYSFLGFYEAMKIINKVNVISPQLGTAVDIALGIKLAAKLDKPSIVISHGRFGNECEDVLPTANLLQNLSEASYVVVNRKSAYDFLAAHKVDDVVLMQNPIPVQEYKRPNNFKAKPHGDKIVVLFIGRLNYRRGAHIAIEAFIHAAKQNSNIELWVVGDGELKYSLMKIAKENGLNDRIIFFGTKFDVKPFLWQSDVFLATSPIANFPSLSLREAMAAGLSVIATDVGETRTIIIPEKTGVLVQPDSEAVGKAIMALEHNKDCRSRLSANAVQYAENNFDLDLYCSKLAELYHQTVS